VSFLTLKSHRTRWHRGQQMSQHCLRRWNSDYLQSMQYKHKWLKSQQNFKKKVLWSFFRNRIPHLVIKRGNLDGLKRLSKERTYEPESATFGFHVLSVSRRTTGSFHVQSQVSRPFYQWMTKPTLSKSASVQATIKLILSFQIQVNLDES